MTSDRRGTGSRYDDLLDALNTASFNVTTSRSVLALV